MNKIRHQSRPLWLVIFINIQLTTAWVSISTNVILQQQSRPQLPINKRKLSYSHHTLTICHLSAEPKEDDNEGIKRTTFDEAGRSLVEEEDTKRMEAMGDYDLIPNVRQSTLNYLSYRTSQSLKSLIRFDMCFCI
jgi:hypothetical protein